LLTSLPTKQIEAAPAASCVEQYDQIHSEFVKKEEKFWRSQKRKRFAIVRSSIHMLRDFLLRTIKVFNVTEYASLLTYDKQRSVITADRAANPNREVDTIKLEGSTEAKSVDTIVGEWLTKYESFQGDVQHCYRMAAYHEARFRQLRSQLSQAKLLLPKNLQSLDTSTKGPTTVEILGTAKDGSFIQSVEPITTYDNLLVKVQQERAQRNSYLGTLGFLMKGGKLSDRIAEQTYLHQQLLILKSRLAYYEAKPEYDMSSRRELIDRVNTALRNPRNNPSFNQENIFGWKTLYGEAQHTVRRILGNKVVKEIYEIEKQLSEVEKTGLGMGIGRTISIGQVVSRITMVTALFTTLGFTSMSLPDMIFYHQRQMRSIAEAKTDAEYERRLADYIKGEYGVDYFRYINNNEHIPFHKKSQIEDFMKTLNNIEARRNEVLNERQVNQEWQDGITDLSHSVHKGTDLSVAVVADTDIRFQTEIKKYLIKHYEKEYTNDMINIDNWLSSPDVNQRFALGLKVRQQHPQLYTEIQIAAAKRYEFQQTQRIESDRSLGSQAEDIVTEIVAELYDVARQHRGEPPAP